MTAKIMKLVQLGLIEHIIDALGLNSGTAKEKLASSKTTLLTQDIKGNPANGDFSYALVVSILYILQDILILTVLMLLITQQDTCFVPN